MNEDYAQQIRNKEARIEAIDRKIEALKEKRADLFADVQRLRTERDAASFQRFRESLGEHVNVDDIMSALAAGRIDLSQFEKNGDVEENGAAQDVFDYRENE